MPVSIRAVAVALLLLALDAGTVPLGNAFTYQGRLVDAGLAANGSYDLSFSPYDAATAGNLLRPAVVVENVLVVDGVFSVAVDFGAGFFAGDRVFLEIGVRPGASSGAYTTLTPRQEVTPAPYALRPAPASVGAVELANSAVDTFALADAAVTAAKLAPGAVGSAQIADGSVGTTELADASVTTAKLAPNAVGSAQIVDTAIVAQDLSPALLNSTFWRLGGNAGTGAFLGTTDATPLDLRSDVGVTINGARFNNNTELTIRGTPSTAEPNADLGLWPRGSTAFFNFGATGSSPADNRLTISSVGTTPFTGYVQRLLLTGTGSIGIGSSASLLHAGSFVFADESSATALATTGNNQVLLRASGGVGINAPALSGVELNIGPAGTDPALPANLWLGGAGTVGQFRFGTSVAGASDNIGRLQITNTNSSYTNSPIMEFFIDGASRRLGLFRGTTTGSFFSPNHPLHVGDALIANSGNGAHLTVGGVWTNGSSRAFKEAFTAVDAEAVLERLLALPISTWRYRGEDAARHLGPVAEDFKAAFGLGGDPQYIGTVDADGVALASIQGLARRLERENQTLRTELAAMTARLDALEAKAASTDAR
jgi:hypothetical protein